MGFLYGGPWLAWKLIASIALAVGLFLGVGAVEAHHSGQPCYPGGPAKCLPLLPSPFMNSVFAQPEIRWCLNDRSAVYPDFQRQTQLVHNVISAKLGIPNRQVAFGSPSSTGCWIQHNMRLDHPCQGCAAWVHYLNSPILVEYNEPLLYSDWRTTLGHELGHAIAGIHEQYDDARFVSHIRTYGYWATNGTSRSNVGDPTVMDFGSNGLPGFPEGVWEWTGWDVARGCDVLDHQQKRFTGCGFSEPPPPPDTEWGVCESVSVGWRCWNNNLQLWVWWRDVPTVWVAEPFSPWYCTEGCP